MQILVLNIELLAIFITLIYIIYRDSTVRKNQFELQIKMAEAQTSMTNPMNFDDIEKLINGLVMRETRLYIQQGGYFNKTSEELSLLLETFITEISTNVHVDLSKEIIRQWNKFSTEEYMVKFIINSTKTAVILVLEEYRVNQKQPVSAINKPAKKE